MTQLIKNAARAALAAGIAAADTSLTVDITKADLFPAANTGTDPVNTAGKDWFKIVVEDASHNYEIMYVRTRTLGSAVMSNLLRGQEGTTAISFSAGSIVGLRITASDYQNALDLAAVATTFGKSILAAASAAATRTLLGFSTFFSGIVGVADAAAARTAIGAAASGSAASSGLTMATSRLLGRTTTAVGEIEEISVGAGLSLSGGSISVDPSAVSGSAKTLRASATGTNANISASADEIAVENGSNSYRTLRSVSLTGSLASSGANGLDDSNPQTVTITIASPGVLTLNGHGFVADSAVVLATSGALPTGLAAGTTYYVVSPTTNTFQLSATKGGAAINTSGSQSGVHTVKSVLAINTWYSKWVIWNGTTTAMLLSSSQTNPVLPSGYTHKARTGWVYTDGTINKYPLGFKQYGRRVQYVVAAGSNVTAMPVMASGVVGSATVPNYGAIAVGSFVPSTASRIQISASDTNGNYLAVAPNNSYGAANAASNRPPLMIQNGGGISQSIMGDLILESTNIYCAMGDASSILACLGWEDNL